MTLDEAINRSEASAKELHKRACEYGPDKAYRRVVAESAREYEQIAEWLKDYKRLLIQEKQELKKNGKNGQANENRRVEGEKNYMAIEEMYKKVTELKEETVMNGFQKPKALDEFFNNNWLQILDILDDALYAYLIK